MAHNLIAKIFYVFFLKSKSVILSVLVPVLKLDNHIYFLSFLNTFNTEKCLDINNTNASKLYKILGNSRCASNQSLVTDLSDFNRIVSYKTMSSFYKFKRGLALTNTRLTCDKYTYTIYIN